MSKPGASYAITPQLLLRAYSIGLFPMAESAEDDQLFWVDPEKRAIFPLDTFIVSRSLAKTVRSDRFEVVVDRDFDAVIEACAAPAPDREKTWINDEIRRLYRQLFDMGFAHTVECWREGQLVGGLYGVALRGAFFGESMFHRERDASKVALAHLVARLRAGGFHLLDTQFMTTHLASLGAIEISRDSYHRALEEALCVVANFHVWKPEETVSGRQALAALED
ncbi:leucyl/phenylalanyl-tRNA--protein transferase [Methylocystis sp. MJC1]|jgi:leucyl/phenylalanyl-tRNA--protein transferase|uniref:leucyl/phenylalanyl-tRNA--protein transferase n=1 Tax=Methylocystis sp. MJC1 TaxID=2654282 RepID=UPI0013EE012B|nr:leucyl/phenylalanyl-tRNA--protein transferase [Methylocystis sp. MJC1]KAF2989403.1 Leucyl/phenylalanyl-tRNA--protein transferase [Methylocystis sp. MJC1]MBU6526848.1 leucyl/phenylalanyl-tRNA--protein transferase [Methylocystis sp. MJC1]UZX13286.1 leucyl/phenylalanyl-tRNA--protein transferase [Methylocystis sp. MJC1]